jgi:hypothetical protein
VEETLRERLAGLLVVDVGLVAGLVQHVGHFSVYFFTVDARLDHGEGCLLALEDGVVHLLQPFFRLALDERAGHVRVVAGREVHGEDVQDDGFAGL